MNSYFVSQFEIKFALPFSNVTNILEFDCDSDDDGIYHYIDVKNKNVYSFDTFDEIWLEKKFV